jgi:glycosyl transferase family 4
VPTVLIIAPDFTPSSLPPATRVRFFATHLPEFGWQPIVLTVDPRHYEVAIDPDNEHLLEPSLEVSRTGALSASWTRKIGIGDIGMRSLWQHWRAIKRLCSERRIDLIFIPVPPYVPMVLGRLAHARFGIPYVVDYIDPWVSEYYWKLPRKRRPPKWRMSYALSRCLEPFALRRAQHITGVSRGTTDQVVNRYAWLTASDATDIPYGAEAGDFEYLRQYPRQNSIFNSKDGKVHVCYVGAYVESMEQTLRAFFAAFRQGLARAPGVFEKVVLHFIGTTYSTNGSDPFRVTAVARDCDVAEWVREHPQRVPYLDSLQMMFDAHALILLGSSEPHYTASKVFSCVLAQRPLLAVFHEDSSVITILTRVNAGRVVTFNEVKTPSERANEISRHLEEMLRENNTPQLRWEALEPYTTRSMAGRLAAAFDKASVKGHRGDALAAVQKA